MSPIDYSTKTFPIQRESRRGEPGVGMLNIPACEIPWSVAVIAYAAYTKRYGCSQSLEGLAERGGFGRDELLTLLDLAADDQRVAARAVQMIRPTPA